VNAPAVLDQRRAELDRLREVVLVALIVTIPTSVGVVVWSPAGGEGDWNRRVSISPFDVALGVLLVLALVDRRGRGAPQPRTWTARIAIGLAVVLAVALLAHPSPRGVDFALRIAAGLAVIDAICRVSEDSHRRILAALAATGGLEAVIAVLESARGGDIGLGPLEFTGFHYQFGSSTAAHAGFGHPYHLACFLLVALTAALLGAVRSERRGPWLAGAALIALGLATTYGRAVALTLVIIGGIALFARGDPVSRRTRRQFAGAIALGFLVGAVGLGNGWWTRAQDTSRGGQNVDDERGSYAQAAGELIRDHPLLGVGPGRYTIALESIPHTTLLPAHNAVLLEAAEAGVVAGALTAALLVALALRALRAGPHAAIVFCALILFFLLDAYPYTFPAGLALSGLWLGLQERARREPEVRV
jgi:O-antigen ligase